MTSLPLTICLFTSTRGHFDVKTRYLDTLHSLECLWPIRDYADRIAHIKVSPEDSGPDGIEERMTRDLQERGFRVLVTMGKWNHGQPSHGSEYLKDMERVYTSAIKTPYVLALEDDWRFQATDWLPSLRMALRVLEDNPNVMQIRLPRYTNEAVRINDLHRKHGLERWAVDECNRFYSSNDFSANPSIYRTRDIRAAVVMTRKLQVPQHPEHGLGEVLRGMSPDRLPLWFFYPQDVRIGHIGTKPGEEDDLSKPLIAS